ncbi:MAG: protein kinase [Synergistaceae bacterium]|jgi:serine/threonine protein kinase|nr:protein kinase [Synergistaceae bacterium]
MEHLTQDPGETLKEMSNESQASYVQSKTDLTHLDNLPDPADLPGADGAVTLRYGDAGGKIGSSAPVLPSSFPSSFSSLNVPVLSDKGASFRGWAILEQLPTKGAEADIYLVQVGEERCVLKLYRHRLEPKIEVLNRVSEMSRNYSRCFVVFRDVGFDEHTGRWYELQEYISLGSLRDLPPEVKRAPDFARTLVAELAEAIHCLHLNEIVHCDIKPANILVRSLAPLDLVLTDFGISSILASDMSQKMTSLKGTPMYWAPEAFSRAIGRPCDWWGLGMIVLELLVGEHPFEGLTDSQIIHKLTIGNVEVPEGVGPREAQLIKGLLTKDDARRWGHEEVLRWLSGEGDIPVHYENPQVSRSLFGQTPFRFEGRDYTTAEELALVFAGHEKPWLSGTHYLRYIRQWLESNMLFDEATELGDMAAKTDPERALFRFVHSNARCPFSLLGKLIDAHNLYLFSGRGVRREASAAESRIVNMMGNGQLISYYDEYISLSSISNKKNNAGNPGNEGDSPVPAKNSFLYRLLLLMDKKTLSEQWEYFQILHHPENYLWPERVSCKNMEETLETLESMGTAPLRRETFGPLEKNYVLPQALLSLFRAAETYAQGAAQLQTWQNQELLLPRYFASDSSPYENLSLDEYAREARIRCLGHTPAILEKLDFLIETLPALDENEYAIFVHTADQLKKLKDRKITSADSLFISKVIGLLSERRKLRHGQGVYYGISGFSGGLISWLVRIITGQGSDLLFMFIYIAVLGGCVLGLAACSEQFRSLLMDARGREREDPWDRNRDTLTPIGLFFFGFVLLSFLSFGRLIGFFPNLFPFLIGVLPGCVLNYMLHQSALSQNARRIADTCSQRSLSHDTD